MAVDNNGQVYEYRNLRFCGVAYSTTGNISLTATINGNVVFSGEVPTVNEAMPWQRPDLLPGPELFTLTNSTLFPTTFFGSYPMSIAVSGGDGGVFMSGIVANYMGTPKTATLENASIDGTTLTIGSITSGTVSVGQWLTGAGITTNPHVTIVSGSGLVWTLNRSLTVPSTTITTMEPTTTAVVNAVLENASIDGTTLTIGSIASGTVAPEQFIGPYPMVMRSTQIVSGSGLVWTVNNSQTVASSTLRTSTPVQNQNPGSADVYRIVYIGMPFNSENTSDPRSSVTMDGIQQVPPLPVSTGCQTWIVDVGSTIAYNLNIAPGCVA